MCYHYEPNCWYWVIVELFFKVILLLFVVFLPGNKVSHSVKDRKHATMTRLLNTKAIQWVKDTLGQAFYGGCPLFESLKSILGPFIRGPTVKIA